MNGVDRAILSLINKWDGYGLLLYTVIAVLISGILSSFIGLEREMKGQAAGLRTHVLVSIGCTFLMIISVFITSLALSESIIDTKNGGFNLNLDVSRIAAGILSGIGFMGAGSIIKNGLNIKGLTTAATLWLVSAIGMACGIGFILEAVIVAMISFGFLVGLHKVERLLDKRAPHITLEVAKNFPVIHEIRQQADKYRLVIKDIKTHAYISEDSSERVLVTIYFAFQTIETDILDFIDSLSNYPYVYKIINNTPKKKKRKKVRQDEQE